MTKYLQSFRRLSVRMGSNSSLIQASGGNTSLKGENIFWVKASGKSLKLALEEDIFVALDLTQVIEEMQNPDDDHNFNFTPLGETKLRPSIETTLHALMPHRVVLHSHPIDVIALSLLSDAQAILDQSLIGIAWQLIPYCRPGKPLTRAIDSALACKSADVLILANHGLVVGGDSPDEAEALQSDVISRLRLIPRLASQPCQKQLDEWLEIVPGARLPHSSVIHSLATDSWSFQLAQRNPAYPDHVVFCGVHPWIACLGTIPPAKETSYGLIPGVGVILLDQATSSTEAMLQAQAEVCLRIPPNADVQLLTDSDCSELLNWDAEKYRQILEKGAS